MADSPGPSVVGCGCGFGIAGSGAGAFAGLVWAAFAVGRLAPGGPVVDPGVAGYVLTSMRAGLALGVAVGAVYARQGLRRAARQAGTPPVAAPP